MDDIDEPYRVIRPRHQERVAREERRRVAVRRNRILIGVVLVAAVVGLVVAAVVLSGDGSSRGTDVAAGSGEDASDVVDGSNDAVTGPDGEPGDGVDDGMASQPTASTYVEGSIDGVDEPVPGAGDDSTDGPSATNPVAPSEQGPGSSEEQPSEPSTVTGPATGTIVRSCGATGTGDCRIAVRSGPSTSDKAVGRMKEGDTAVFECTVMGESVRSTALGESTSVWAKREDGRYVSMAYLDVPGWDVFETTHPC